MGGGGAYTNIKDPLQQAPFVACSLNGFCVPRDNPVVDFQRILAIKDQARRDRMFVLGMKRVIQPFGTSLKAHQGLPTADGENRDPPIAVMSGPVGTLLTGRKDANVGDLIEVVPCLPTQATTKVYDMFNQTATKRQLIVRPYEGVEGHDIQSVRDALNIDGKRLKMPDYVNVEKAENLDAMMETEVFSLVDYTKHVLLHALPLERATAAHGPNPSSPAFLATYKQQQEAVYAALYKPDENNPATVNLPKYGKATLQRYAELLVGDVLPKIADVKTLPVTENLLQALDQVFQESQQWILGVASTAAAPGSIITVQTGFRRA